MRGLSEQHLADAMAMHQRIPAPYWIARTRIDLAELYLQRRAPARQREAPSCGSELDILIATN